MKLKELMRDAGMVGAGGAGFPSYAKIAEGADTLLVNGSECEPLLYTDLTILREEMDTVLCGIVAALEGTGIPRAVLCIKEHTAEALGLTEGESLCERVSVKVLENVYPIGDEISIIFEALGRVVRPGNLPISVGVIVYNVETLYNLGRFIMTGEPVLDKWLTVGGDTSVHAVVKVPIGTRVSDLFEKLGVTVNEGCSVLDGGPSMGKIINYKTATVTKTTKALLVLPDTSQAIESKRINEKLAVTRAETACCQCTRCTDMCPRHLLGYPLEPHKMVRTAMSAVEAKPIMVLSASLCCGCGICESLACSQGISPKAVINNYKSVLRESKLRFISKEDVLPRRERDYRKVPSSRWARTLGVAKFDTPPNFLGKIEDISRVEIPLDKHIGIPSIKTVKDGDEVMRGDVIAVAAEGLSIPQHASISGKVTAVNGKITIGKVN